ncbi:hypothetical protein KDK88_03650, partial [bacterium]|nr:hypothetical protein [bacterium]
GDDTSADPNELGDGSDPGDEDNSAGGNDGDPDSAGDGLGMMDDPLGLNSVGDGSFRDDLVRMQLAALIGVPAVLL